ncbi:EAL domain-containing protein [Actinomadura decatromicini]|nr:EAL domain-containing protein [Actinomadura decatromicini]
MPIVGPTGGLKLEALAADTSPLGSLPLAELAAHDCWMVFASCLQVADLQDHQPGVGLSVNVHPAYLEDRFLAARIAELVAFTGLDPRLLTLEVTECRSVDLSCQFVRKNLIGLHAMGMSLAIDDFGAGYATAAQVKALCGVFSFRYLKLDMSLMQGWASRAGLRKIRHAAYLAQRHGLEVVAEGIETAEQLDFVRAQGWWAQGFFIGKKTVIETFKSWKLD